MTKNPLLVSLEAEKKYFWCTCGESKKNPFCDGAHKDLGTGAKSLHFTAEKTGEAFLCGCKKTKNPPYCDGSHSNL